MLHANRGATHGYHHPLGRRPGPAERRKTPDRRARRDRRTFQGRRRIASACSRPAGAGVTGMAIAARLGAVVAALALSVPGLTSPARAQAPGPSFSCAGAKGLDAVVCGDPTLATRDRTMARLYAAARTGALGWGQS